MHCIQTFWFWSSFRICLISFRSDLPAFWSAKKTWSLCRTYKKSMQPFFLNFIVANNYFVFYLWNSIRMVEIPCMFYGNSYENLHRIFQIRKEEYFPGPSHFATHLILKVLYHRIIWDQKIVWRIVFICSIRWPRLSGQSRSSKTGSYSTCHLQQKMFLYFLRFNAELLGKTFIVVCNFRRNAKKYWGLTFSFHLLWT